MPVTLNCTCQYTYMLTYIMSFTHTKTTKPISLAACICHNNCIIVTNALVLDSVHACTTFAVQTHTAFLYNLVITSSPNCAQYIVDHVIELLGTSPIHILIMPTFNLIWKRLQDKTTYSHCCCNIAFTHL